MGLYQAILKMQENGSADESIQVRADRIQSNLDELVRALNERCKKYRLYVKPTTSIKLLFGWQLGIQNGVVDQDEEWDEENLARDGEDYPPDAAGDDSDDGLESPLTLCQAMSLNKGLMSAPTQSSN